jgi:hypothetical protein
LPKEKNQTCLPAGRRKGAFNKVFFQVYQPSKPAAKLRGTKMCLNLEAFAAYPALKENNTFKIVIDWKRCHGTRPCTSH